MNLIRLSDIRKFWPVSLNLDENRIAPHIHRAQERALRQLISPELYEVVLNKFVPDFQDNIFSNGVKDWRQSGLGVTFNQNTVTLTAGQNSQILNQEVKLPVGTWRFKIDITIPAGNTVEVYGFNLSDASDADLIASTPATTSTTPITTTIPYRYLGFRIVATVNVTAVLNQVNILSEDRIDKLMHGEPYRYAGSYDRRWPGCVELLSAYAYAYLLDSNSLHVTRGGNVKKTTEQSTPTTERNDSVKSQEVYSEAIRLEGEFFEWITMRQGIYPEYQSGSPNKVASFNFWNASRGARYV